MPFPYEEFDLSGVAHVSAEVAQEQGARRGFRAAGRRRARRVRRSSTRCRTSSAAADFKAVVARDRRGATRSGGGIVWGIGAHVIKTGLGPVLIDLMERGFVSALATNGAAIIHDFEIALVGATSEDVDEALGPGRFGMAEETGRLLNGAINEGVGAGLGIGQAVGDVSRASSSRSSRAASILAAAAAARHPADGARRDRHRHHPHASGGVRRRARRGQPARFPLLRRRTSRGSSGGVYLNCGSAVVLPEVFLKAVALARNRGIALDRPDDGQPRFRAACTARRPTS